MAQLGIKSFELRDKNEIIEKQDVFFEGAMRTAMGLEWTIKDNNWTSRGGAGNGDSILSQGALKTHGNLIFMCGYGDGIGIRRINDDGTFTTVYNEALPANGYGYYTSLAVDKKRKQFYVGNWVYDNLTRYSYSDTSSILASKETLTQAGNDLPSDEVGYTVYSGLEVVGDYLYIHPDDAASAQVLRWLIPSQSNESLTVKNQINTALYGHIYYDEDHDRVYQMSRINGMYRVVTNPSATASYAEIPAGEVTASAFQVRVDTILGGNDTYGFVCVPDNDNPNLMWLSSNYGRYAQVDIAACIAGTSNVPTLIKNNTRYNVTNDKKPFSWESEGPMAKKHPVFGSDMPILRTYGGWGAYNWQWLDTENGYFVGMAMQNVYRVRRQGLTNTTPSIGANALNFANPLIPDIQQKISGSEGTEYWVIGGYGADGNALISYAVSDFPNLLELATNGYIIFGDYQLADQKEITGIKIENLLDGAFEPTDTRLDIYVSNNSGSVWESYGWRQEAEHTFTSSGNTVRIKFAFRGTGKRGAWITTIVGITATIKGTDFAARKSARNYTSTKLQGI